MAKIYNLWFVLSLVFLSLSVSLSLSLYLCLSISISVSLSLSISLSLFLYLCFSISVSLCLYLCVSISISLSLSLYLCFSLPSFIPSDSLRIMTHLKKVIKLMRKQDSIRLVCCIFAVFLLCIHEYSMCVSVSVSMYVSVSMSGCFHVSASLQCLKEEHKHLTSIYQLT